jgi:hypothetical protein
MLLNHSSISYVNALSDDEQSRSSAALDNASAEVIDAQIGSTPVHASIDKSHRRTRLVFKYTSHTAYRMEIDIDEDLQR